LTFKLTIKSVLAKLAVAAALGAMAAFPILVVVLWVGLVVACINCALLSDGVVVGLDIPELDVRWFERRRKLDALIAARERSLGPRLDQLAP
jgi:hypothetical protein